VQNRVDYYLLPYFRMYQYGDKERLSTRNCTITLNYTSVIDGIELWER